MDVLPIEILSYIAKDVDVSTSLKFALCSKYIYESIIYICEPKWRIMALNAHKKKFSAVIDDINTRLVLIVNIVPTLIDRLEQSNLSLHYTKNSRVVYWRINESRVICVSNKCTKILGMRSRASFKIFGGYRSLSLINSVRCHLADKFVLSAMYEIIEAMQRYNYYILNYHQISDTIFINKHMMRHSGRIERNYERLRKKILNPLCDPVRLKMIVDSTSPDIEMTLHQQPGIVVP
jgi:hypothetical protein